MHWLYLALAIAAEVLATSLLRSTEGFSRLLPTAIAAAGYATAFYLLSLALRVVPTGVAYALWSGIGIVLIAAVAWAVQGQRMTTPEIAGAVLIILGVGIMSLSRSVAS